MSDGPRAVRLDDGLWGARLRAPAHRAAAVSAIGEALRGGTVAGVAARLGVGERTLWRWLSGDAELRSAAGRTEAR